jgi:hypothetical protein
VTNPETHRCALRSKFCVWAIFIPKRKKWRGRKRHQEKSEHHGLQPEGLNSAIFFDLDLHFEGTVVALFSDIYTSVKSFHFFFPVKKKFNHLSTSAMKKFDFFFRLFPSFANKKPRQTANINRASCENLGKVLLFHPFKFFIKIQGSLSCATTCLVTGPKAGEGKEGARAREQTTVLEHGTSVHVSHAATAARCAGAAALPG